MNVIQEIKRINEEELKNEIVGGNSGSWHQQYRSSAYVFAGGLPYEMTEGDILCVFSQWGEIDDITLGRDDATGKSKGFAFIKYEDQRSTVLAVDNFNGITLIGRIIRVDHMLKYRLPKELQDKEEEDDDDVDGHYGNKKSDSSKFVPGHAYQGKELASQFNINSGVDLYGKSESESDSSEDGDDNKYEKKRKRRKEEKKDKKMKKISKKKNKEEKKKKKEKKKRLHKEHDQQKQPSYSDFNADKFWGRGGEVDPPLVPVQVEGDDSWRGRYGVGGGKGDKRGVLPGQHMGGFGTVSGKGAKLMGPKFGGGGGGGDRIGKGKGKGASDGSFGGMGRLR